jgi:hypothetical protein
VTEMRVVKSSPTSNAEVLKARVMSHVCHVRALLLAKHMGVKMGARQKTAGMRRPTLAREVWRKQFQLLEVNLCPELGVSTRRSAYAVHFPGRFDAAFSPASWRWQTAQLLRNRGKSHQ